MSVTASASQRLEKRQILSIIIPCFNEELGLPNLFDKLAPTLSELGTINDLEVIFIDDGSTDRTYSILESECNNDPRMRVVKHERNRGIGAAVRTGFSSARGDILVATDSDCTYPVKEIPRMLELLDDGCDIVTASPYHPDGNVMNVPNYRLFLSKGVTRLYNLVLRTHIHTYTAMFRAYKRKVIEEVNFESDSFIAMVEILARAVSKGFVVKEMPTTLYSRVYGTSKMKMMKVIWGHMTFIVKVRSLGDHDGG
ncbi:MAG: glycosyltransferase family 2 protein [Euryarchaeota archaeon]|nr:glycosyltransferase family 2 protein [Euryarchaeota archaeon]